MCQEKCTKRLSSAALLKQLADGTYPQAQAKPTPLPVKCRCYYRGSRFPYNGLRLDQQASTNKASSCFFSHSEAALCCKGPLCKAHVATQTSAALCCQASLFKAHVTNPTAFREVSAAVTQQKDRAACQLHVHIQHGLPLNKLVQFNMSASCVLSDNLSALVTHLIEGAICFEGGRLIDKEDLLVLRGCRPTSEQKYLTNFTIKEYRDVIAKQGTLEGKKVEYLGWERFERAVQRKSAQEIRKARHP